MKLYNTLTRKKEQFITLEEKKVYFINVDSTVYWNQHIGNLRSVVLADFINRTFRY